jgi:uncharacterized membrane protein YdjX (TVP38/TMEM64 family)
VSRSDVRRMRRYWTLVGLIALAVLGLFFVAQALEVPFVRDPTEWMGAGGVVTAALGVGVLAADVLLPVPSAGVMLLHGAFFGIMIGTALSLAGSIGAAVVGFRLGRAGERWVSRLVSPAERTRADRMLARWGLLAIVISRPIPILAETVVILAGASPLRWEHVVLAASAGSLPPAFLYAVAGATTGSWASATMVFAGVLLMSAAMWLTGAARPDRAAPERAVGE